MLVVLPNLFMQRQKGMGMVRKLFQLLVAWKASWLVWWSKDPCSPPGPARRSLGGFKM